MIRLDDHMYKTYQTQYEKIEVKAGSTGRSLTGRVARTESSMFETQYTLTLVAALSDLAALRASYQKASPLSPVRLIDEEGTDWDPDDPSDPTGVYFWLMQKPKPLSAALGWGRAQRFTVGIGLLTNAYYGVRPLPGGRILAETSDFLTTEDGHRLLWQGSL